MRKIDKIIQWSGMAFVGKKYLLGLVFLLAISVSSFGQKTDTICNGESVTLRPSVSYETIEWTDEDGNVLTRIDGSGVAIPDTAPEVSPDVTKTYTAKIVNIGATNLIKWGDFESEPIVGTPNSFQLLSDYKFYLGPDPRAFSPPDYDRGFFTVTHNPELLHDQDSFPNESWYTSMADHTTGTGDMFVANGSTNPNSSVLTTKVAVTLGTTYIVSAWFANIHTAFNNPYEMDIYIDGIKIDSLNGAGVGGWYQHFSFWESTKTDSVVILFKNKKTTSGSGNDFAIDDVVFAEVTEETYKVVVKDVPEVVVNDTSACYGEGISKITSTSSLPIQSQLWTAPSGFLNDNTVLVPSMADNNQAVGTYEVSLEVLATNGCSGTSATESIVIHPNPEVLVNDTSACYGVGISEITSSSTTLIQSVVWTDDDDILDDKTALVPAMADNNQAVGTYKLSLEVTSDNGCKGVSPEASVVIDPNPVVVLEDQFSELGNGHTFEVEVEGDGPRSSYAWIAQDGLMNDPSLKNPELADKDQEPGEYPISVKVINGKGCQAESDTKLLTITAVDTIVLEMPKAFTPASNSSNSIVYVKGLGISEVVLFQVFNRWGNLIFESSDKGEGWDGYYNGKLLPSGAYGYHVTVRNYAGKEYYLKGSILLLH